MRFCPTCDNILIPRKKRLICRVCGEKFEVDSKLDDFTLVRVIQHDDRDDAPIIAREGLKRDIITVQERKAFEEFFNTI